MAKASVTKIASQNKIKYINYRLQIMLDQFNLLISFDRLVDVEIFDIT